MMMFHKGRRVLFVLLLLSVFPALYGQNVQAGPGSDDMVFKVAIFGPSDEIFIWWGHAALIVENTRWGVSRVFDWGIFSYPSDNFLLDFLRNQVRYKCVSSYLDIDMYVEEDRDIVIYTLDLDRAAKETILKYAENNVLPENCYYDYHEFRDNCSTRIRDILDMGTGRQLQELFANTPGRFTLRQHIRRFSWFRPFSDGVLDFLMGQDLDEPVTVWDEMFLPVEIGRSIVDFRYTDGAGTERKLVRSVEMRSASKKRQPILNEPLERWPRDLALGTMAAALMLCIAALRKKHPRAGRILWGLSQSILGLFFGTLGCVLCFGLFIMPNDYIQQNSNVLFINPLLLAAVPLGIAAAVNSSCRLLPEKWLRVLWTYVFAACLITVLAKILPAFHQQNQSVQLIMLPLAFVLSALPGTRHRLRAISGNMKKRVGVAEGNYGYNK